MQLAKTVAGQVQWEVNVEDGIGSILKSLLPTENFTDDGVGNGGQHAFTPGDTLPPGLTVKVGRDVDVMDFYGGRIKSLQLQAQSEEVLKGTVELSFKDADTGGSSPSPAYTAENPLVYHTGTFTVDATSVPITAFSVSIGSGLLDGRKQIGSALVQQQMTGQYAVTGELTAYFENLTLVNKFLNGTPAAIVLDLTGTAIGTTTRRLKVEIPTAFFNGETPKLSGVDGEVMLKLPFEAVKTGAGSPDELIRVTLNNSRRSAY